MPAYRKYNTEGNALASYEKTQMQKEKILQRLRQKGCRITKQREMLLDIILEQDCASCKEIYYKAVRQEPKIGTATVYRMINILEDIGAINRKNMYRVSYEEEKISHKKCTKIEFDDNTVLELSEKKLAQIIQTGLDASGYETGRRIRSITECTL